MGFLFALAVVFMFVGFGMAIYYEQKLTNMKIKYNNLVYEWSQKK